MFRIEKMAYGFKLTFADAIDAAEMRRWSDESKRALAGQQGEFGVLVDMRTLKPLTDEAQKTMVAGQALFRRAGMVRSAVILESTVITMQFRRLAQESGIYQWERYISAKSNPAWERIGIDWLTKAIDPDAKAMAS